MRDTAPHPRAVVAELYRRPSGGWWGFVDLGTGRAITGGSTHGRTIRWTPGTCAAARTRRRALLLEGATRITLANLGMTGQQRLLDALTRETGLVAEIVEARRDRIQLTAAEQNRPDNNNPGGPNTSDPTTGDPNTGEGPNDVWLRGRLSDHARYPKP